MTDQVLTLLQEINHKIQTLSNHSLIPHDKDICLIMGALAKAQGTYKPLEPTQEGPFGLYANLADVLRAVRESLSKNGLAFYQHIELLDEGSGAALLHTVIGHESGQSISSTARVVSGKTDRDTGRSLEYHKRLHAVNLLGIAPSKNDPLLMDDDGVAQQEQIQVETIRKGKDRKNTDREETINKTQYDELLWELDGYEDLADDIMKNYAIATLADLPKSEYHTTVMKIRKIKKTAEEYERRL